MCGYDGATLMIKVSWPQPCTLVFLVLPCPSASLCFPVSVIRCVRLHAAAGVAGSRCLQPGWLKAANGTLRLPWGQTHLLSSPVSGEVISVLVSLIVSTCVLFCSVYLGSCFVSSFCLVLALALWVFCLFSSSRINPCFTLCLAISPAFGSYPTTYHNKKSLDFTMGTMCCGFSPGYWQYHCRLWAVSLYLQETMVLAPSYSWTHCLFGIVAGYETKVKITHTLNTFSF